MTFKENQWINTMKYYLISDTHFCHKKLIEWGRPEDFEERLKVSLSRLTEENILIHLGDICMGGDTEVHEIIKQLPCKKILIKGNHDKNSDSWYLEHGWDFICDSMTLKRFGKTIYFAHRPSLEKIGDIQLHGHTHGNTHRNIEHGDFYDRQYHKEIAMENTNYKLVELTDKLVQ